MLTVFALLAVTLGLAGSVQAEPAEAPAQKSRPKVGLVLAGGGAKGASHIGVLKYIEELGIPIDYIAGTSMGSIIGGLYALGYTPVEMDSLIKSMDWSYYMSNNVQRSSQSYYERSRGSQYLLTVPFAFTDIKKEDFLRKEKDEEILTQHGEFVDESTSSPLMRSLPSGFINGDNLVNLFSDLCIGYQDSMDFRDLPIPYACVTTDMLDGSEQVLRSGYLAYAMRSSMAIPVVFAPVEYDGKLLVDGGMVNNFPVDVCHKMGADIIIGVELTKGFYADRDEINSLPGMLGQLMNIVTSGRNAENRKLCDIYIRPDVTGYGTMSFDSESIDSLVMRGYNEALTHSSELKRVKRLVDVNGPATKKLHAPKARTLDSQPVTLSSVVLDGVNSADGNWLMRKWRIPLGTPVDASLIRDRISKFNGTGAFKNINYSVTPENYRPDTTYRLSMRFTDASPHNFSVGLRGDTEEAVVLGLRLGLNDNRISGWKASLNLALGYNPEAEITGTYSAHSLIDLNLSYDFRLTHDRIGYMGENFMHAQYTRSRVRLYLSEYYSRSCSVKLGADFEHYNFNEISTDQGISLFDSIHNNFGVFGDLKFDSLDDSYYAKKGIRLYAGARYKFLSKTEKTTYETSRGFGDLIFRFESFLTPGGGRFTLSPQLYFRQIFGTTSYLSFSNFIGGEIAGRYYDQQLPFVGVRSVEYTPYSSVTIARLDLRYNFLPKQYLTAIVNGYVEAKDPFSYFKAPQTDGEYEISMYSKGIGAALKYTLATAFGPLSFNVHWANISSENNRWGAYLSFGYNF